MNLSVIFSLMIFMMFCFPLYYSPVSMVGVLMVLSISSVGVLSLFGSFWYSYILFLIYVGGLLVLLIYICLVSSNFPIKASAGSISMAGLMSLVVSFSMSWWYQPLQFLGQSGWNSGTSLVSGSNISIFLFLVVLLLAMLLVVVRVSGAGFAISVNEKS